MRDEVEKIHFVMSKELIEAIPEEYYEVFERLQDGEPFRLYRFRPLAARFLVDESGKPLPETEAYKVLGKIPIGEWGEIAKRFMEALADTAIPKASANLSGSPSVAASAEPSPDGAT